MKPRALFVAATKQHVGKTTTCLGLVASLQAAAGGAATSRIGYMKPVGQQHVPVTDGEGQGLRVDKDCKLFRERFGLDHCDWAAMSPVVIPRGYTKDFVDGKIAASAQKDDIRDAFGTLSAACDFTVIEGTGHVGVGSIVDVDNAEVAKMLDVDVVLVAEGGLGRAFDELSLNKALCDARGARVAGVILNKVLPDKLEETRDYFSRALERWGVPLLGCVPHEPLLESPAFVDYERLFKTEMMPGLGTVHRFRHFDRVELVATSLARFMAVLEADDGYRNTLWVTHGSRAEIVLGLCSHVNNRANNSAMGLILTGRPEEGNEPADYVKKAVQTSDLPVLHAPVRLTDGMAQLAGFTSKLNLADTRRTDRAVTHVQAHLDEGFLRGLLER